MPYVLVRHSTIVAKDVARREFRSGKPNSSPIYLDRSKFTMISFLKHETSQCSRSTPCTKPCNTKVIPYYRPRVESKLVLPWVATVRRLPVGPYRLSTSPSTENQAVVVRWHIDAFHQFQSFSVGGIDHVP